MNLRLLHCLALSAFATTAAAQSRSGKPPTWMDLAAGTDVTYAVHDENKVADSGGGSGSGGSGDHVVRIVSLGADAEGAWRIAVLDEQLPKESFETAIVRAEIAVLDPATGLLQRRDGAKPAFAALWSPQVVFPYPALSEAEWKAKQPVARESWAPVAGEANELPLLVSFAERKEGKKKVPVLAAELDAKQPMPVRLVGIAGIVAMAEGQMPRLGANGIEPVAASLVELRREFTVDMAKGRVTAVHTTGKVSAADGKVRIDCDSTQQETERRLVKAKDLPQVVEVVEELCAIAGDPAARDERRARAQALLAKAKQAGFGATAQRLLDSLTRDGLPPGLPR